VLACADLCIGPAVAREALADPPHADVRVSKPLIQSEAISILAASDPPAILSAYDFGKGEHDIIAIGLKRRDVILVIDDHLAFIIATRFGLRPLLTLDVIVELVHSHGMPKTVGIEIVRVWQSKNRFGPGFLRHTFEKLNEVMP